METKGKRSQMCVVAVLIKVLLTSIYLTVKVHFQLWPTPLNVFFWPFLLVDIHMFWWESVCKFSRTPNQKFDLISISGWITLTRVQSELQPAKFEQSWWLSYPGVTTVAFWISVCWENLLLLSLFKIITKLFCALLKIAVCDLKCSWRKWSFCKRDNI